MSRKTIVAKFGGTSLADSGQIRKVIDILKESPERRFVVVSAPGKRFPEDTKVTDLLLGCYENAASGRAFDNELGQIKERFGEIISGLGIDFPLDQEMDVIREKLENAPEQDYTVSRGEYLNARILAACLDIPFVDPAWCICFREDGTLDPVMTKRAVGAALRPLERAVIAGYYGADLGGKIHTFSRGGSDITGSIAASAIGADLYENWTDVSGLYSADPRIVKSPKTVDYLSYRELRTLSYMGATVLHTDAVLPVADIDVPINIRNTNKPEDPGTIIVRKLPKGVTKNPVTGVAGRTGMSVIQVEKVMVSDGSGFTAIMLDILKRRALPFEQCLTGIDTITLIIRNDLLDSCRDDLLEEIRTELNPDFLGIKEHLAMIAVTGEKDTESSDANVRVLQALTNAGIEISTINQGAGKLNLLVGVPEEKYTQAIRTIYETIEG